MKAAIKTVIILLSFFVVTLFLSFIVINIPSNWILPILGVGLFCVVIHGIYRLVLNQMKWDEEMLEREQKWKNIDAERYERKMTQDDTK